MRYGKAHGFTLIEILVALAIASVIMVAIFTVYRSQQKSYITQEQVAVMHQNVRAAMYYMEREIRMAGCDPTGTAAAGIITAGANLIRFTEDIRGRYSTHPSDGDTNDPNEDITYTLADPDDDGDTDLVRNTGGGNMLVAENISSLSFQYQDGEGNTTSVLSEIRFVQVTLTGTTQDKENESTVTTRIHCRNLEM